MWWSLNIAWVLFLWTLGVIDIKSRSVSKPYLIYGWLLTVLSIYIERLDNTSVILGGILGCVFILVSKFTKEALGYGDSIVITLISMRLGGYVAIYTLGGAFGMAAIYGMICQRRRCRSYSKNTHIVDTEEVCLKDKVNTAEEIPFLPFLAMACTLSMVLA